MSEAIKFPVRRLRDAGATNAEIVELQLAFARSDAVHQREFTERFKGKSKIDVQVWLEDARGDLNLVSADATETQNEPVTEKPKRETKSKANASVITGNEDDDDNES